VVLRLIRQGTLHFSFANWAVDIAFKFRNNEQYQEVAKLLGKVVDANERYSSKELLGALNVHHSVPVLVLVDQKQ
jgi:hypothetical protein